VGFFNPATVTATASCLAGDFVVGGGQSINATGYAISSYPNTSTSWRVTALVYADAATVTAYAVCADITP
jgi:hypothetical protein